MQINRIDSFDLAALAQGLTDKQAKPTAGTEKMDSLSVGAETYVSQALALPKDGRREAIEEAKALLASGELDNIENIREAAANMVKRGI
jgi:hypothetical protein